MAHTDTSPCYKFYKFKPDTLKKYILLFISYGRNKKNAVTKAKEHRDLHERISGQFHRSKIHGLGRQLPKMPGCGVSTLKGSQSLYNSMQEDIL